MKVAILGTGETSYGLAPWKDESWEIWLLNDHHVLSPPRWNRWFQVHDLSDIDFGERNTIVTPEQHLEWLKAQTKPVYIMPGNEKVLPSGIVLPKDGLIAEFGHGCPFVTAFFNSAIAWELAFAITLKPEVIGVWGCEMGDKTEYGSQRYGLYHFMVEAYRRGIEFFIPPESELSFPPLPYPEEHPRRKSLERRRWVYQRGVDRVKAEAAEAERQAIYRAGQLAEAEKRHVGKNYVERLKKECDEWARIAQTSTAEMVKNQAYVDEMDYQILNFTR